MESILQSSLLADAVAEEERRAQVRLRRRSADSDCPLNRPSEPAPTSAAELELRKQAVQEREKALKEREERLESEASFLRDYSSPAARGFSTWKNFILWEIIFKYPWPLVKWHLSIFIK